MSKHKLCPKCKNTRLKTMYYQNSSSNQINVVIPSRLYCSTCDKIFPS